MRSVVQPGRNVADARNHALERDEEQREHEQVQEEPIEPHRRLAAERSNLRG